MGKQKLVKTIISLMMIFSTLTIHAQEVKANELNTEYDLVELNRGQKIELIEDGDFEKGGLAWDQGTATKSISTSQSYGKGTHAGMLPANNGNSYIGQIISVKPNTEYTVSAYVKTEHTDAKVNFCVRVGTENQLKSNSGTPQFDILVGGDEWERVEQTFNSGEHSYALIELVKWVEDSSNVAYASPAYIDCVSVKESSVNLIEDGGFENGHTSWQTTGTGTFTNYQGAAANGEWCGLLPSQSNNACVYQVVHLKPNTDYVAKAKVLLGSTDAYMFFNVKTKDVSTLIHPQAEKTVRCDQAWVYQDVELSFNSGNYTEVALCAMKWSDSSSDSVWQSQVYVDDVSLYEVVSETDDSGDYEMIWADDFQGNTLDASKWGYELGCIRGVEQQHYVNSEENVFLRDGKLVLKATDRALEDQYKNPRGNRNVIYNSGSVRTHGKYEFLYGRIEMKAKLPKGKGVFPAFWTLGADFVLDGHIDSKQGYGWARCGEIDIMELTGTESGQGNKTVWQTIHTDDGIHEDNGKLAGQGYTISEDFYDDYHIFGIDWSENRVEWYVDDKIVCVADYSDTSIAKNVIAQKALNRPQYIQMNLAMGGNWPGDAGTNLAGTEFVIDYVYYAQNQQQKADAKAYYDSAPHMTGLKDITMVEGDTPDLVKDIEVSEGYHVDYSIEDGPMFKNTGGLTSVSLLCKGKDDLSALATLKPGVYHLHYSAIDDDIRYTNGKVDTAQSYQFARKTVLLTVEERVFPSDWMLKGIQGNKLSTITLPEGWSWKDPTLLLNNHQTYVSVFEKNGVRKEVDLQVEVINFSSFNTFVEEAEKILENESLYTFDTVHALKEAIHVTIPELELLSQDDIDCYTLAIEDAIKSLVYKKADYSKVDEVISKIPNDLNQYTDETIKTLNDAVAAVVKGLDITQQGKVDAMAKAILEAIEGLKEKPVIIDPEPVEPAPTDPKPVEPMPVAPQPAVPNRPMQPTRPNEPEANASIEERPEEDVTDTQDPEEENKAPGETKVEDTRTPQAGVKKTSGTMNIMMIGVCGFILFGGLYLLFIKRKKEE